MSRVARAALIGVLAVAIAIGVVVWTAPKNAPKVTHGVVMEKSTYHTRAGTKYVLMVRQCEGATSTTCLQGPVKVHRLIWEHLNVGDSYPLGSEQPGVRTAAKTSPSATPEGGN